VGKAELGRSFWNKEGICCLQVEEAVRMEAVSRRGSHRKKAPGPRLPWSLRSKWVGKALLKPHASEGVSPALGSRLLKECTFHRHGQSKTKKKESSHLDRGGGCAHCEHRGVYLVVADCGPSR
jgi:hypothetical protein